MVALYVFLYVEVGLENYKQHIPEQYIRFLDTFKKIPLQENSNWNFQRRGVNIPNGQKSMICRCEDFVGFLPGTLSPLVSYSSGYLPFLASVVDFFPGSYRFLVFLYGPNGKKKEIHISRSDCFLYQGMASCSC